MLNLLIIKMQNYIVAEEWLLYYFLNLLHDSHVAVLPRWQGYVICVLEFGICNLIKKKFLFLRKLKFYFNAGYINVLRNHSSNVFYGQ